MEEAELFTHLILRGGQQSYFMSASLVQRSSLPSLRKHASHLLSNPIFRPSKMNTLALSYIDPKLWNSPHPIFYVYPIVSMKSPTKTVKKYIKKLISGCNL